MEKALRVSAKQLAMAAVVIILILMVATCSWRAAEEKRRDEEIATAEGLARVVSTTFSGQTDLKVSNIDGWIDVTSVNHGRVFNSKLKATLPYSVDYFVDLSKLNLRDSSFDEKSRTLTVEIPDVRVASPNIDLTRGKVGDAEGFWVSREASKNLVNRAVRLTKQKADETANTPENLNKARNEGRDRIEDLLEKPLAAAGLDDVKVVARYPTEGTSDGSRITASVPYAEAIKQYHERRAAEGRQ
ncbi:MAG: DUF4230 domain-containing protein [Pseudomonadota bacterium]